MSQLQVALASQPTPDAAKAAIHLANERTFVAWCCVGVLLVVAGVLTAYVTHMLNTSPAAVFGSGVVRPLIKSSTIGLSFFAAGTAIIILACYRFLHVQKQIEQGDYQPSSFLALAFLGIILVLMCVLVLNMLEMGSNF